MRSSEEIFNPRNIFTQVKDLFLKEDATRAIVSVVCNLIQVERVRKAIVVGWWWRLPFVALCKMHGIEITKIMDLWYLITELLIFYGNAERIIVLIWINWVCVVGVVVGWLIKLVWIITSDWRMRWVVWHEGRCLANVVWFVKRIKWMSLWIWWKVWEVSGWWCWVTSNFICYDGFVSRAFSSPNGFFRHSCKPWVFWFWFVWRSHEGMNEEFWGLGVFIV